MKATKQTIREFNSSEVTLVISGWPETGRQGKSHGVAWYTKETLTPQAMRNGRKYVVLAEKNHNNQPMLEAKGNILVLRVFDDKRTSLYPQILTQLSQFPAVKNVFVHSEFGAKGGLWHFALLLPFLAMIRMTGRRLTFYSHNAISSVRTLSGHLNVAEKSMLEHVLNMGLKVYYAGLTTLCDRIVVLDEAIAKRLSEFIPEHKIVTLPIPVRKKTVKLSQAKAKEKLGVKKDTKVIMFFGFVTWYKGADWLVKTLDLYLKRTKRTDIHLVIAGGESHSLSAKDYYRDYFAALSKRVMRNPKITMSGFVPDGDLPIYFAAADLVVFPYRGLMGASGSMVHALSYDKPVMVSNKMKEILTAVDAKDAMTQARIGENDLVFDMTRSGMEKMVSVANDGKKLKRLAKFAELLRKNRSITKLVSREDTQLYGVDDDGDGEVDVKEGVIPALARVILK